MYDDIVAALNEAIGAFGEANTEEAMHEAAFLLCNAAIDAKKVITEIARTAG